MTISAAPSKKENRLTLWSLQVFAAHSEVGTKSHCAIGQAEERRPTQLNLNGQKLLHRRDKKILFQASGVAKRFKKVLLSSTPMLP